MFDGNFFFWKKNLYSLSLTLCDEQTGCDVWEPFFFAKISLLSLSLSDESPKIWRFTFFLRFSKILSLSQYDDFEYYDTLSLYDSVEQYF